MEAPPTMDSQGLKEMEDRKRWPLTLTLRVASAALALAIVGFAAYGQQNSNGNLSPRARVTTSSVDEGTNAESLVAADTNSTHWAAKDGTDPAGTWVELDWPDLISFREIVIRQEESPKLSHVALEIRGPEGKWRTLQSMGDRKQLLPRVILAQFSPQNTTGVRLSRFAGRVNLSRIEVYNRIDPPVVRMGSDLRNHILGVVTDGFGTRPFSNVRVDLQGFSGGKPWEASVQTDERGIFAVDLPVGLEGNVHAVAHLPDGSAPEQTILAGDLAPGLSLPDESTQSARLDGSWRFKPDPESDFYRADFSDSQWKQIRVPSHWTMEGFESQTGTGGYRRHFEIPVEYRDRRIKLVFDGVYSGAEVWLNGNQVGSHDGGFAPFELDITREAKIGGDNVLAVLVREDTLSSRLDHMSYYANFPLAGIIRSVRLLSLPDLHVRRFHVQTTFDANYRDASLQLDLSVENESNHEIQDARFTFSLEDFEGHSVPLFSDLSEFRISPWSRLERHLTFHVTAPQHWEAEHPRLYILHAELSGGPNGHEQLSRQLGFREVQIRGTELLINGVPIKLRGADHYESDPLMGRVAFFDLTKKDLSMMKEANLDAIRTSTFPAVEDLYDLADQMGFYIEEEGPFCWVDESSDLRYLPTFVQRTAEMLDRDRSHPSVIYWSVGNESTWGPDFEAAHEFLRVHDASRPVSAGQSATLELDTMHNPITLARMEERKNVKVPIIWDESFCIFQGDIWGDTKEMWLDPGDRDYYIEPLIPVWDAVQSSANVQGAMIWAWVDDIFLVPGRDSEYGRGSVVPPFHALDGIYRMPGRGIVGDAPWGIVDGWRRKKPEFWHVKMLMSPIHFHERDLPNWVPGSPAIFKVDNRYEYTNLSELTLEWSTNEQHGTMHPDIRPRSTGTISIPVGSQTKAGDALMIRFVDSNGRMVIPQEMRLGVATAPTKLPEVKHLPIQYRHEPFWLGGPMDRFIGEDFEIAFDGANGRIRRALVNRHSVLYETPKLHVLPIGATEPEFPLLETWRLIKPLKVHPLADGYEVVETGTYRDFSGEMRFRISPDGGLRVSYEFTYTGHDVRAREIGLQFGVPLWCDRLEWKRKGEWTVYPEDHIGRNEGIAMAHAPGPQAVPPMQAFALDDTPLGTNDFRSTKRNFVYATLTDKEGYGIGIEAVGSQHLRAMVNTDLVQVNVNDWFGGVAAVAYGEWWQNYGTGHQILPDDPNQGNSQNRLSGSVQLYLLSPLNSAAWLRAERASTITPRAGVAAAP